MTGGVCARVRERATFQLISTTLRAFPSKTETGKEDRMLLAGYTQNQIPCHDKRKDPIYKDNQHIKYVEIDLTRSVQYLGIFKTY